MTTLTAPAPAAGIDLTIPDPHHPISVAARLTGATVAAGLLAVLAAMEQAWTAMYGTGAVTALLLILATLAALKADRAVSAGQGGA